MITKKMERLTSQKKIISDYLKGIGTHPSAEDVYCAVRKKLPRISKGTVYRNLKGLKEKGEVQEIPTEVSHYDSDVSSHAHFICRKCNKIIDIFDICRNCRILKRKKIKVGKINNYQISFYGYCKNCE